MSISKNTTAHARAWRASRNIPMHQHSTNLQDANIATGALDTMSATKARAHDLVDKRSGDAVVDWLALEDDVWRAVAKLLRLDVYTLRRTCKALRRILPLAEVPITVQRARDIATHMRNLDKFRAPMGTTAENLLARRYSPVENAVGRRVPLYPKRSNALRTVNVLVETPLGELCELLRTLRESSPQLKIEFTKWLQLQPVRLALRHRLVALRECHVKEHLPFSQKRLLPRTEFGEGVKLFYEVGLICSFPTCIELCQLWHQLAAFGHHELMRELWDDHFTRGWTAWVTQRRRRALLTWRCEQGRTSLDAAETYMKYRMEDLEERFADDPDAYNYLKTDIQTHYPPTISFLTQLYATHIPPALARRGSFVSEDDQWEFDDGPIAEDVSSDED